MFLSEWVYASWLCEGHLAKHMKEEAAAELLSGDKSGVCVCLSSYNGAAGQLRDKNEPCFWSYMLKRSDSWRLVSSHSFFFCRVYNKMHTFHSNSWNDVFAPQCVGGKSSALSVTQQNSKKSNEPTCVWLKHLSWYKILFLKTPSRRREWWIIWLTAYSALCYQIKLKIMIILIIDYSTDFSHKRCQCWLIKPCWSWLKYIKAY